MKHRIVFDLERTLCVATPQSPEGIAGKSRHLWIRHKPGPPGAVSNPPGRNRSLGHENWSKI